MTYGSTITIGELTLEVTNIKAIKVPGTSKQVVGKNLILKTIPARQTQDWDIRLEGKFTSTTRGDDKTTLRSYDDCSLHTLTDGEHNGEYFIVPTSLEFDDDAKKPTIWEFKLRLIQDQ